MTSPDCRKQKFLNRSSAIRNDNREVIKSESHPVHVPILQPHGYTVHGILQVRILEWVAFPFFGGSSQPRDQTQVSCIAGRLFTSWVTREIRENKRVTFHGTQLAYQSQITVRQVIFTQKPTVCYKLVMKITSHLLQKMFTYFSPYSVFRSVFSQPLLICSSLLLSHIQINLQSQPSTTQQEVAGNLQGCNFTR